MPGSARGTFTHWATSPAFFRSWYSKLKTCVAGVKEAKWTQTLLFFLYTVANKNNYPLSTSGFLSAGEIFFQPHWDSRCHCKPLVLLNCWWAVAHSKRSDNVLIFIAILKGPDYQPLVRAYILLPPSGGRETNLYKKANKYNLTGGKKGFRQDILEILNFLLWGRESQILI